MAIFVAVFLYILLQGNLWTNPLCDAVDYGANCRAWLLVLCGQYYCDMVQSAFKCCQGSNIRLFNNGLNTYLYISYFAII